MKRAPFNLWRLFRYAVAPVVVMLLAWMVELVEDVRRVDWRPTSPILSVIIPCYNCEMWLSETLHSLSQQTFKDFTVIFIDDGSKEPVTVNRLRRDYSGDIRLYRHARNMGLSAARNTGVMLARQSRFIVFLDPDDLMEPTAFEKLLLKASTSSDPRCAFIYPGVTHFRGAEKQVISVERVPYSKAALWRSNFITSFALIRRTEYMAAGGMCEARIKWWEDYDFWLRLSVLGYHGELMGEPVFWYRRHALGRSSYINLNIREVFWRLELDRNNPRDLPQLDDDPEMVEALVPPPCYHALDDTWLTIVSRLSRSASLLLKRKAASKISAYVALRGLEPKESMALRIDPFSKETVLFMIPWMQIGGADSYDLDIIATLSGLYHIIIVTEIDVGSHQSHDAFKKFTDDIFQLPTLVDVDNEEQVNSVLLHLVNSRNVKHVYVRNSFAGYKFVKFLSEAGRKKADMCFYDVQHLYTLEDEGGWEHTTIPYHKNFDKRIVISQDLLNHQLHVLKGERSSFKIIPPSVDLELWKPAAECTGSEWTVMFVGRVDQQKDPLKWLQVAKILKAEQPSIRFVVIGDGSLLGQMQQEAESLEDAVEFSGRFLQAHEIKTALESGWLAGEGECRKTLLLMTSRNEGLPIVILEAIAMGRPVVAPPVGAIHELVGPAGGLLHMSRSGHVFDLVHAALMVLRPGLQRGPSECRADFARYSRSAFSDSIRTLFTT